jgi:hypothetical protein
MATIVAFIMDSRTLSSGRPNPMNSPEGAKALIIDVTTTTNRYSDARRAYSIAWPEGWKRVTGSEVQPFDVVFNGPNLMSLSIQVTEVPHETIDDLVGRLRNIEKAQGVHTHMEVGDFHGHPAVWRTARLTRMAMRTLDVLAGGREYHLQAYVPSDIFDTYLPAVNAMLESFMPSQAVSGDETTL